ncbi:MAG: transglutaminase-like cysteine peptidase [Bdellovibrionales bacterium]|jgi:predicted transglutaminase-like cysteine proteinase|nr:transglutaminase-like cysteine peptidase [Bdellovibrionales bacterium]
MLQTTPGQENSQAIPDAYAARGLAGERPAAAAPRRRGFIRRVSGSFRTYRLGDLMVAAGLLTEEQLQKALAVQSARRQPLGRILVEEGYITAVQLYRKLGEQWCIKTSAAGVAFMLQTFTPSAARADDNTHVRLAAAFSPAASQPVQKKLERPKLFGSMEIRSNDISAFTKWTTVMARFEQQMKTAGNDAQMQAWKAKLQSLGDASTREKIAAVNTYINQVSYVEDIKNYGQSDYWATPVEFFRKGGDCEDFAIAKYASLRALGFTTDQLRINIVQDKIKNIAHAILIVYTEDGTYVLDNQDKRLRHAAEVTRYQPVFSINATHWWMHRMPASGANS